MQVYLELCKSAEVLVVNSAIVFGTLIFCGRKLYIEFFAAVEDARRERKKLRGE